MMLYKIIWLLYTMAFMTFMYWELRVYELYNERKNAVALAAVLLLFVDVWRFLIRA
jgi:hypothetical protein